MWEELNRWAKDELRSLNGQIEYVLREAVRKRQRHNEEETAVLKLSERPKQRRTFRQGDTAPEPACLKLHPSLPLPWL